MFSPDYWRAHVVGRAQGRGDALFLDAEPGQWVLRHFRRGGLPGRIIDDRYVFTGLQRTRPLAEFHALSAARKAGVAVPRPVAAAVHRCGVFYRGDILMERIVDARSLADLLSAGEMPGAWWDGLAEAVAGCHRAGFWHADLNARNVLCREGRWWLIDFDRARSRAPGRWAAQNIARLKRSLDKLTAAGELSYAADDWKAFVARYQQRMS